MALLTIPQITKGAVATLTLDKAALVALIPDPYYSVQANWYKVVAIYKASGLQHEFVIFNPAQGSPQGSFLVSSQARDSFSLDCIMVFDFDGGSYRVERSSIPSPASFDVAFSLPLALNPDPVLQVVANAPEQTSVGEVLNGTAPFNLQCAEGGLGFMMIGNVIVAWSATPGTYHMTVTDFTGKTKQFNIVVV